VASRNGGLPGAHNPRTQDEAWCARRWLGLAIATLVLAGLFSLVVVIGRMPPFDRLVTDPLFFKRGLVVHVNLALVAWFYAFVAALLCLLPSPAQPSWVARRSPLLAGMAIVAMLFAAALPGAKPVLSNYIPMIDHWLFASGQILFAIAVLASFTGRRLLPLKTGRTPFLEIPDAAISGLRAAAYALLLAAVTFSTSWAALPAGLDTHAYYELLVWGGGHVLQLACSVAMVSVWIILIHSVLGSSPVSRPAANALLAAMIVPWLLAPLLALQGGWTESYRQGFTHLMQLSIFPVVSIFLILCSRALWLAWRAGRIDATTLADPRLSGFLVSAALTVLGFALGAAISGSNTMIPAHYHASIGAVTAAFMTLTYLLLGSFGFAIPTPRLRRIAACQPLIYGVGQMIFAAGFGLAGVYGMSRKAYGAEQASRGLAETIGLGVMGVGGLLAVAGGILFLTLVVVIWRRGADNRLQTEVSLEEASWRYRWAREIQIASIRFRN